MIPSISFILHSYWIILLVTKKSKLPWWGMLSHYTAWVSHSGNLFDTDLSVRKLLLFICTTLSEKILNYKLKKKLYLRCAICYFRQNYTICLKDMWLPQYPCDNLPLFINWYNDTDTISEHKRASMSFLCQISALTSSSTLTLNLYRKENENQLAEAKVFA